MRKYWASLTISLKADTIYTLSVLAWRVRSVLRILIVYILWSSILTERSMFANYSQSQLLSYILLVMLIQTVVFSSRTIDVGGEISSGDFTNILLKPINYFKYYLAQDLGNKAMNLAFSVVEFSLFLYFFRPPFYLELDLLRLLAVGSLLVLAVFIYYFLNINLGFLAFYIPENVWAPRFLFFMILDFLAGGLFPLDILPRFAFSFLMLTPFPYFVYFPVAVYLGRFSGFSLISYSLVGLIWLLFLSISTRFLWRRGLKAYEAWGR